MKMEMPIEVAIRIRPRFNFDFLRENACIFALPNSSEMLLPNQSTFMADYMFGSEKTQNEVFEVCVKPLINLSLKGKDISFIAFGPQTSGKSFTMFGNGVHFTCSESGYGVIPRVVRHVFTDLMSKTYLFDFKVGMSIMEVFDGRVRSILGTCEVSKDLPPVLQRGDVFICKDIAMGISFLHIAMTRMEQTSKLSRMGSSEHHYIVTLHVFERMLLSGGRAEERFYKINMVDLGSSHQTLSDDKGLSASSIPSIRECSTSLITMSRLATLPFNSNNHFSAVPDLFLFEVLRDICYGSIRSLIFCCLSPADINYHQTVDYLLVVDQLRTLGKKYADVQKLDLSIFKSQQIPTEESDVNLNQRSENEQNNSLVDENLLHLTPLVSNLESDSAPAHISTQSRFDECIRPCENSNLNQEEADDFGAQFATTQMKKLVTNAEDLFNHMLYQPDLSDDFKQDIDQWLYHKQEYDSCTTPESNSACEQNRMALEKIEEVTESDDEVCSSSDEESNFLESTYSESGSGNESSFVEVKKDDPVFKPDFNDKLDNLMENFQRNFDKLVDNTFTSEKTEMDHNRPPLPRRGTVDNYGRRKSILPGDDPINLDSLLKKEFSPNCLPDVPGSHSSSIILEETPRKLEENIEQMKNQLRQLLISDPKSFVLESLENSKAVNDEVIVIDDEENASDKEEEAIALPYYELKSLLMGSEAKQNQLDLITLDLQGLRKRMGEIQGTIEIKEKFIAEMIKNTAIRTGAKARIEIKHNYLESEYFKARSHLALAEKALHEDKNKIHEHKVDKYKTIAEDFERRLHNIDMINQMTGDSAKKVLELESSLQQSKRKLQKLMKQAQKFAERKLSLEVELIEDQKKIKELDGKYKLPEKTKETKDKIPTDVDDVEAEKLPTKSLPQMLKEANLKYLKEKVGQDKNMSKDLMQVGTRINHLDQVMKEKCTSLEEEVDVQTKEAVSHEIRNLRRTRDCLDEQRFTLVAKFNKDKVLSNGEERKFLECDEAIEAIDATIEYKNSLICGGGGSAIFSERKNEEILLARLSKLSLPEMKSLLCKYFHKVIDLRENGRKMECQIAELDHTTETQQLKIQKLTNALQQTHLEFERRMVVAQREHQEKLHLLYRHFADDSSGPSSSSSTSLKGYLRAQNKSLKQRLTELETRLLEYTDGSSTEVKCPRTTLVTRHKNKLIIQQQKIKKSSK